MDNEDFDNENEVEEFCFEYKGKVIDVFVFCVVVFVMLNIIDCVRGYGEMYWEYVVK